MPPLTPMQLEALLAAQQRARGIVRQHLVDYSQTTWNTLGSWRDPDVARFVDQVVPAVEAGKQSVVELTDVYLGQATGVGPVGAIDVRDLRGVDDFEVYQRPGVQMRTALSEGKTVESAVASGATRVLALVTTDLQMAAVRQARQSLRQASLYCGYRRVPSSTTTCALCLVASTQLYRRGDLMPIHPGCQCDVEAVRDEPGTWGDNGAIVLDQDLLDRVHAAVAEAGFPAPANAAGYKDLLVVRKHGEIGPVLTFRGQHFTGPGDLALAA